jgi:hypothetical protein
MRKKENDGTSPARAYAEK